MSAISKDFDIPSVASTLQEGQENRTLKVTLLSREWRSSTDGDLSTINRELAIQLAKHSNVEVSVFLPQCNEEDRNNAASHHVQLVEAEKVVGWNPDDWLINVPDGHVIDCVVGHGVSLGRQVQFIRKHHHCKWIQVVHTVSEELGMYKSISQGEQLQKTEVKLCEMADQIVAIGPKVAEAYKRFLCRSKKEQNVFDLTPSIFSEFLNVEQATEERRTFSVLVIGSGNSCEDFSLKGFDLAAQAVAELKDKSYKLKFVGAPRGKEGEIADKLLQRGIDRYQLIFHRFSDSREILANLFCESDLAIMPSKTEGFGVSALKALSAGLPVLVSGNSGLGEALQKVPLGSLCVVDSEDPKDWAQNIKMVRCKMRNVRLAESILLRESYQKKYSWKESIGILVEKMYSLNEEVPLEIRARGRLALRAFKKALSEGRTCIKRVPIMLIGQDRSGKTSLAKSLKGERFNPEEDSTVGIQADPSYFKVSTEIWKPGEKDEQQNVVRACSYEHHAARLIVQNLSEEESVLKEESLESDRIEHLVEDIVSASCVRDENMIDSCSQSEKDVSSLSAALVGSNTTSHDPVSNSVGSVSISVSQDYTISDQQPAGNIQTVPDDVASLVEVLLGKDDDSEREEDIYSVLWDFGGQEVYYTTHPLFFTSRAIYLLVNDLSRPLHHKAESVMKQGMFTKSQDSFRLETNADYLGFWMSSIASLTIQDKSNSKKTKSDMLPELPPVFLVCTHADEARDTGDPRELGRTVFGHLQTKPYKNHLHDVFVVDNTKSGQKSECPEVLRLRKEIRAVAEELPHMKEAVPIKWLKFEKEMQAKKDEGNEWIFLEEAKEIAGKVCNVSDDEEFRTLLNFLHDQRVLIHFDDTPELNKMVVLDPQWLINVFKEVITIRPFDSKEKKFKELWSRLEIEGVLEEPLLEHVWGPLYRKEDTCQSLIAIMEKFSLLCSWPSSDGSCGKQYLVPSMLMSHPLEEIIELITSAEIPPLFLKFETGQVPPGLFPRLVLQVLQWCKQECTSPEHPQLHHNFARIYRSEEVNCSVILLCHISSIEVVVHRGNDGHEVAHRSKSAISSPVNISHDNFACEVLRQLELVLESMRREFCWLQNMKYEVSFLCPVCCPGRVVNYCRTHRTKGCKQEECLHFWSESVLCREKKAIGCTRSASAKDNKVLVRDFELWFSPTRNQLTVDKCDDGNLASVKDGKETFSAGEVLQIRFTQQRDDQTVSPQLKGSLQLEGACPVMPNSDSKSGEMLLNPGKTTATTEICLPDSVEKSLLSASCDAKEIVHQLMENLQLNKDVFERPDHGNKKIIRSLAHRAKDLKRLDVFEHLREIAPAGTTGPLLPENLLVQRMPITKLRELSISLSGGDEWMKLAEGLGLTPAEIRFLDKRTLNPMDAALSFIVKQRFLRVGELYELLEEHNFPVLADLL